MSVDWLHFTPWSALTGGLLIGLAVAVLLVFDGRIAGISGIVGSLLEPRSRGDRLWRAAFVGGLLLAPVVWRLFHALPAATFAAGPLLLVIAGLLVGVGTRYASGCTSGHGVCGIARASPRSLVATGIFMVVGFLAVYVARHVVGP